MPGRAARFYGAPENQRWSLDADLFDVEERNFDRLFGLQKYHVVTGHVSLFYESPWYGLIFGVHAGQYLAGDLRRHLRK